MPSLQAFNPHNIRLSVWKYQLKAVAFLIKRSLKCTEDVLFLQPWEGAWWWIAVMTGCPTSSKPLRSQKKSLLLQHSAQHEAVIYPASWQSKLPNSELWAVFSVPRSVLAELIWCPFPLLQAIAERYLMTSWLETHPWFLRSAIHSTSPWMPKK